jgi:hypothetical protein
MMKETGVDAARGTHERDENSIQVLVGKPKERDHLVVPDADIIKQEVLGRSNRLPSFGTVRNA